MHVPNVPDNRSRDHARQQMGRNMPPQTIVMRIKCYRISSRSRRGRTGSICLFSFCCFTPQDSWENLRNNQGNVFFTLRRLPVADPLLLELHPKMAKEGLPCFCSRLSRKLTLSPRRKNYSLFRIHQTRPQNGSPPKLTQSGLHLLKIKAMVTNTMSSMYHA